MSLHDTVVIGASAGGLQALTAIIERLPATLEACVLVVIHTTPSEDGVLPRVLERVSALPVTFANNGDALKRRHVYVARPDAHLVVTRHGLGLVHGPRENGFRPAIDPLFRTAARELGPRVIGVILSGALSDGTYGLSLVKHCGGIAIVQDPGEAIISSMPLSVLKDVDVDHVLRASDIAGAIERLTREDADAEGGHAMAPPKDLEPQLRSKETRVAEMQDLFGPPSALTCPDCGGALWEVQDGRVLRYQCHVGHQYAPDNLEAEQREAVDSALWSAVRVLEEHAELKMRLARRVKAGGLTAMSEGFAEGARDAHEQAQRIRSLLFDNGSGGSAADAPKRVRRTSSSGTAADGRRSGRRAAKTRRARRKG